MPSREADPSETQTRTMASYWVEATVQFVNPSEELLATFISECFDRGALGSAELEDLHGQEELGATVCDACGKSATVHLYFPGSVDMEEILNRIETNRKNLLAVFPDLTVRILRCRRVQREDWATNWKKSFEPQRVTDRIWIVPPWRIPELPAGEIRIVMEPGLAFGTGKHETTQHCLRFLEEISAADRGLVGTLLDAGCGSGILSLGGKALGASRVVALDKDPDAVQVARNNFALNHVSGIRLITGTLECLCGRFDLVVANLDYPTLLESAGLLVPRLESGGRLILSGFLSEEYAAIRTRYENLGLRVVSEKRDQELGWTTVLFRRSGSREAHGAEKG